MLESESFEQSILGSLGVREVDLETCKLTPIAAATAGILCKTAAEVDGKTYYIKSGRRDYPGFDLYFPVSEMICKDLGNLLGFNVAHYELWAVDALSFIHPDEYEEYIDQRSFLESVEINRELRAKGRVLVNASQSFVSTGDILHHASHLGLGESYSKDLYDSLNSSGRFVSGYIDRMILFDFITCGIDRHHANFGYMLSDGKYVEAPLYDHGDSLFSRYSTRELKDWGHDLAMKVPSRPFDSTFEPIKWTNLESFNLIELNPSVDSIKVIVEKYLAVLGPLRAGLIIEVILRRLAYARRVLFGVADS